MGDFCNMAEKMIKIDPHTHSSGVSGCSHITCEGIIDSKMERGYQGAILVNHCQSWYYPETEHKQFMERVIAEYARGREYADKKGFHFYLGLEVTLMEPHYADWLLYGITEDFLRASPCLYTLTQQRLYELCEECGAVLVQAHPYRQSPANPKYMHGVEINCCGADLEKVELVEAFAKEHDLLITCGTDYHGATNTYNGGIYIPESCRDATDIAKFFREKGSVTVFREGEEKTYTSKVFQRK